MSISTMYEEYKKAFQELGRPSAVLDVDRVQYQFFDKVPDRKVALIDRRNGRFISFETVSGPH